MTSRVRQESYSDLRALTSNAHVTLAPCSRAAHGASDGVVSSYTAGKGRATLHVQLCKS